MIAGLLAFVSGLRLLFTRAELRAVLWRMLGLLFVLMLLAAVGVYWLADYIAGIWIVAGDAWYWQILGWLAWLLAVMLALVSGVAAFVVLGAAAAAPWLDVLALRVESMDGRQTDESRSGWLRQIWQSLANSIRPLLELMLWAAAALFCLWLPPLATALWLYGSIRFLSFELMDTTASRRGWDFSRRKGILRQKRRFFLGFAGLAALLLTVPLLNLFVIPAAVVGLELHMGRERVR